MHTARYNDGQMVPESVSALPAEKLRWGLGRLGYVLAVNAGLTIGSFLLMLVLSYP
jgi:hypothetical protein